jgi:hypothetical protein
MFSNKCGDGLCGQDGKPRTTNERKETRIIYHKDMTFILLAWLVGTKITQLWQQ